MSALHQSGSKDNGTENLQSYRNQPAAKSVLPPFSGKLSIDEKLKLRHENFKQRINDFFKDKNITTLSQLTATPAFPTPYVMAQFASKAYREYTKAETDAQYETRLALPDGWKLLTTASNTRANNGYFGAAYWHPEHQQVVIAHRGTDPKNSGAVWTDVRGVLGNKYVRQMESASTFAYKVVEVLRDVNQEKGTNFHVFFTGHSLGGWLAQITTFTTKYLKKEGNTFLKSDDVPQNYHPHTVVFDSPGCKDMLSKMVDKLDVRLDGLSIDLEHLDITSYLSAPNRINTCNAHIGTVYRIFVDLSDWGWQEKHTALYNLATHSMNKIVEAFDPETGLVRRDEKGELKIQEVVDWPISGFRSGKEYTSFFKWATDLNDYHTETTVEDSLLKGYTPVRYQTKNYDDRVTSISTFSQEESKFLEDYRRLRQLPEFFKPKEMFSAIGNKHAQEEAEKKLQSFEFENETIRCTDASALQALIPYVKRLLQLFPEIKENTKCALSPHEIRNNVYQIGTKRYLEKLHQSPLEFKADALSLRHFLDSDEQKVLHLHMVDGEAWTGLIKVYQVVQMTPCVTDFLSEGHYTVLTLQNLLLVNQMVNLNTLMESTTTPHLLMMSCESSQLSNDETKQIFGSLFTTLRQKQFIKIILTTQSEDDSVTFLQDAAKETLSNGFVTRDEQLTWSELVPSSQEELLENGVIFQGSEIALNQIISADSPVTHVLTLANLLGRNHIKIGEEPVSCSKCNFYDEKYYIDRTFQHKVIIKQDVLNDNREQSFPDLLASTEQGFKQLCQLYPKSNVHWLEKEKSGKLVWQQSQGSLEALRKYIDPRSWHTYTPGDLDKLLEQAHKQRVMLISDTAGMGKSTLLTHLSKQIKQKFPAKWVVRIDLNDHTDALKALQEEQIDKEKAIEFISEKILKHKPGIEMELFKECFEQKHNVSAVILLDGFDEISPSYKETVIDLLQALRQTAVEQLWVTTRPHLREELEDKLQQLSYTLEPFSGDNQIEFLRKFWTLKDWFTEPSRKEGEGSEVKVEIYAKHLVKKLAQSISDKDKEFTGIPLQCRMLAEAFNEEVKTFCQSAESVPELPFSLDLLGLYERFLNRKYDICCEEKFKFLKTVEGVKAVRKEFVKNITVDHQIVALKVLFGEEQVALLQVNSQSTFSDEDLTRTGLVQVSHDGKLQFTHRTFAEYYVAEFLGNQLTKLSKASQQVQDLILQRICLEEDYRVVRSFIDGFLSKSQPSKDVLKQYGNRISDLRRDRVPILHQAAREGDAHIIGFLLESVRAAGHPDTLRELLLAQDNDGHTAWQLAAMGAKIEVLEKLWEWAKEKLTTGELCNKFLLAKAKKEASAWLYASLWGNLVALQRLWEWGKERLNPEELNNKLLLAKDNMEQTALHVAAQEGNLEVLQKLWEWGEEELTTEDLNNKLLLAKDNTDRTAWHYASWRGNLEALQKLWEWGKKTLTAEELNNKLLLEQDCSEQTAWHLAAEEGRLEILQKLWEWGKERLTAEELINKLLLAKDNIERTAWHVAAEEGNIEILEKLWEWGKDELTAEELHNHLLLATDNNERTAWHYASMRGNVEVLEKLWEWGKESLTAEELNNKFLLAKDYSDQTAWHMAAEEGKLDILQKLLEWGKDKLTAEELNSKLFLAKDNMERTAWHVAAQEGNLEVLQLLWERGKERLTAEELNNELLLAKDDMEQTAWHVAAEEGHTAVLETLCEWAKEANINLIYELFFAQNNDGKTALDLVNESEYITGSEQLKAIEIFKNCLSKYGAD
jgi:ankyrin repeat protein